MELQQPSNKGWTEMIRAGNLLRKSLLVMLCTLVGAALGFALFIVKSLQPTDPTGQAVIVSIPQGISSARIGQILEEKGIIRNADMFRYYLKFKKQGERFQAGDYSMMPGMTLDEVIAMLNSGETIKEEVIRFTIPEGLTLVQIAERLSRQGIVRFEAFMNTATRYKDSGVNPPFPIPDDPRLRYPLEGYLFPETYELKKGAGEIDIINVMLKELEKKLSRLPADWRERLEARGLSLHGLLTVASLIERESALDEERPLIASVIYNRLKRGQALQIDATVQYLFDEPKERLLLKDLQIESPYNTYLHSGLPPGPIASPSLASIQAALDPAETNYYYYVTKKDGSQGHLFAETYDEHLRNIAESQKNNS